MTPRSPSGIDRPLFVSAGVCTHDTARTLERLREDAKVTTELFLQARRGGGRAFAELTDPYRHELHVHCYRILGSAQDAEDALQEILVTAWKGLDAFEERASLAGIFRSSGLLVLTLAGNQIREMTRFESGVLAHFGLPRTLNRLTEATNSPASRVGSLARSQQ